MGKTKSLTSDLMAAFLGDALPSHLFGEQITGEEVEFHDNPKIILPRGMTYDTAFAIFERLQQEAETPTAFDRKFLYRSNDGAHAAFKVIRRRYGMLLGKAEMSFFGLEPAEKRTIAIGVNETMQVPWGKIEIPTMKGLTLTLCDQHRDKDYGSIFEIHGVGPNKYKDEIEALFNDIEEELRTNSIYRGRALSGSSSLEFLDLTSFDPKKVVFSDEATAVLEGLVHSPIRYAEAMRQEGMPLKRSILLEGPFGTGKTSEGMILAGIAVENGWTFISARPGKDKVDDVLRTARLYQPAVVFVEDIDGETNSGEHDEVTKFLDAFDGITAKGGDLIAVMTTNHIERIHKGMLRPGRLDAVVHIGSLDRGGIERLVRAVVATDKLAADVNYDEVADAMQGFYPAFVKEALSRAITVAIGRGEGRTDYVIDTSDLVTAAVSLHAQLKQLEDATEGERRPALESALGLVVEKAVGNLVVVDPSRSIEQPVRKPVEVRD